MSEIWCNGLWLPAANHPGTAQDRGVIFGLGLFETMLAIDGSLIFADRHLARIQKSCARFRWEIELPDLRGIATELLVRNGLATGRARLRLVVTAGSGPLNDLASGADRLVWLSAFPAAEPPDSLTACLSPWPRNERSPLVGLKAACWAENLVALDHARRHGCDEVIFLNTAGHLCEAATANLFLAKNGVLLTPSLDSGCLPGVMREVVLGLAGEIGLPCAETVLMPEDLHSADEIFMTSSLRGPVPLSRFGTRELPPGPVCGQLRAALTAAIDRTTADRVV